MPQHQHPCQIVSPDVIPGRAEREPGISLLEIPVLITSGFPDVRLHI
jgi:hypothetical protein